MRNDEMNILFAGVGGTGVLTAAQILAEAALIDGKNVVVGEIHGMAQRGGSVLCEVRIGSKVFGPIIPTGRLDVIVGIEPLEVLRHAFKLHNESYVLINLYTIPPPLVTMGKGKYPEIQEIESRIERFTKNIFKIDAAKIAMKVNLPAAMNIVMVGALFGLGILNIDKNAVIEAIKERFPEKYQKPNIEAFHEGYKYISSVKR
ncbi:MAG: indolepyruvate oxidoreductase subunit beta [Candidatus Asgardarchaeia archaeon]